MEPPSDGQLLAAWHAGETEAFESLVERHQAALLAHARSVLRQTGSAEDVVQDALLRLAHRPPQIPEDARGNVDWEGRIVSSWLHTVTRNLCMDVLRKESRRRHREEEAAVGEAVGGGIERVEAADTRAAVERSLCRLPDDQREVLALRLFGDQSYREIAEITGKKIGTIGWLISTGMKALAEELAPWRTGGRGARGADDSPGAQSRSLHGGLS